MTQRLRFGGMQKQSYGKEGYSVELGLVSDSLHQSEFFCIIMTAL